MSAIEATASSINISTTRNRSASAIALAAVELRAGLRGAGIRLLCGLAFAVGWVEGGSPGKGVALAAWGLGDAAWRYLAFIVIIWMALVAVHDTVSRTDLILYSKPQPTERLVLARFMSTYAQVLIVLCALFAGAIVARIIHGGGVTGFPVYFVRFFGSAGLLFAVGSASYCMAILARNPLAGAVVALYWVLTLAGKSYLAKAFFPTYSQNLLLYVLMGFTFLGIACYFFRRKGRGKSPAALWSVLLAPCAFIIGLMALRVNLNTIHEPPQHVQPALELMEFQHAVIGDLAPGFRLPDKNGNMVSLADFPGKILVIVLWSPADPESIILLDRLGEVQAKYESRGVQILAVCASEDVGAAGFFARGESLEFPVVADLSTHNAEKVSNSSSMANAYSVNRFPHIAVTDRRRRLRTIIADQDGDDGRTLDRVINERLTLEPK